VLENNILCIGDKMLQIIGFHEKPKHYTYEMNDFDIGNDIIVHYAQWLHPSESKKFITADDVNAYKNIEKWGLLH
jgi:hypothetical protein